METPDSIFALPIYRKRSEILKTLARNQVMVIESPTGSGKTTLLPIIFYQHGYAERGMIGITQPRRIAAISVSAFIAQLLQRKDALVAYKIRFEDTTDEHTSIKIMTDGTLLQEIKSDQYLSRYSLLIVDEAHERSVNIDFILGLLKRILQLRDDFRVIISSATINSRSFSRYFNNCPIVSISAKSYPVAIRYLPLSIPKEHEATQELASNHRRTRFSRFYEENLAQHIANIFDRHYQKYLAEAGIRRSHRRKGVRGAIKKYGDAVLIFMSGEKMINNCIKALEQLPYAKQLHILPLFGRLGKEEQDRVFERVPPTMTKVVVATNIAETSITIEDLTAVIDSGTAKINSYSTRSFASILEEFPVSKASANQRSGRAGRIQPGICYRLYNREDFASRAEFTPEEILRSDLSEVVLRMADLGIDDFLSFDFLSSPGREQIQAAIATLKRLDAIDQHNALTTIGKTMTHFPLSPRYSRIIIEAMNHYHSVLRECIVMVSFLTTSSPFIYKGEEEDQIRRARARWASPQGDFMSYYRLLQQFEKSAHPQRFCAECALDMRVMLEISNISQQLSEIVEAMGLTVQEGGSAEHIFTALSAGLIDYICARQSPHRYRSITTTSVYIHPSSFLYGSSPEFIIAGEIVRTGKTYARSVSSVKRDWLTSLPPAYATRLKLYARQRQDRSKDRSKDRQRYRRSRRQR